MDFAAMRVLLTGATGGIGEALARLLVAKGAAVLLQGRSPERLTALGEQPDLADCATVQGDLTCPATIAQVVQAAREFGVNVLINNAGANQFASFDNTRIAELVAANVTAPMALTQSMLPVLTAREESMIVNIGSTFGAIGYPGYVGYCACKHAIKGFSEALSRELADTRVEVLYVSPRATATGMNSDAAGAANRKLGVSTDTPELVASSIVRALANGTARTQLGWPEKLQVKLNAILPGIVDSAIAKQLPIIKQFTH